MVIVQWAEGEPIYTNQIPNVAMLRVVWLALLTAAHPCVDNCISYRWLTLCDLSK